MAEVSSYYLESFVGLEEDIDWLKEHLLDLMDAQGWDVVSDVRFEYLRAHLIAFPKGRRLVRAWVDVEEFEINIPMTDLP